MAGPNNTLFPDEPRRVDIDERTVELVFTADHPAGGRAKAVVAVPRAIADRRDTVELARGRASDACRTGGAGDTTSVTILMGW